MYPIRGIFDACCASTKGGPARAA